MYFFYFDLDNTLMKTDKMTFFKKLILNNNSYNKNQYYNYLNKIYQDNVKKDYELCNLLKKIQSPKYIITNGSRTHCLLSLKCLGIFNEFKGGIDADSVSYKYLKPDIKPYLAALEMSKLNPQYDKGIFFDDIVENHILPKYKLKWITVLINTQYNQNNKPKFIDYCFKDIYSALEFFIKRMK
jgi:FMN phosphatase YigB (HAD superfamily)